MLILTGQRKSEAGDACWSEFDLTRRVWVIPAERMKMDEALLRQGRGNGVPICG